MLENFHFEFSEGIKEGHIRILSQSEINELFSKSHNFVFINFTEKTDSALTKIRPVSNSSAVNKAGKSLNQAIVVGPQLIGSITDILLAASLAPYLCVMDLRRAYRSVGTTQRTNDLRCISYWNTLQPNEADAVAQFCAMNYGDACSSSLLEIIMRFIVIEKCSTEFGKKIIADFRFVDDLVVPALSSETLNQGVKDVEQALWYFSFKIKHKFSSDNDQTSETQFLHLHWDIRNDTFHIVQNYNAHKKLR